MILINFIPLVSTFFNAAFLEMWYYPLLALAIVATVPCLVKRLVR